jgi:hypothetical protein
MRKKFLIISGIIIFIFCLPVVSLFVFSKIHHQAAHDKFVEFINHELDGEITIENFSFSYLSKFPKVHVEVIGISVDDGKVEVGKLDILLNLKKLWNRKLKIEKMLVEDLVLYSQIDSLGNKPHIFSNKNKASDKPHKEWIIESNDIHIKNSKIYFGNKIKGNRMYLQVDKADLNLSENDSLLIFTATITGKLDSLFSNNTLLFAGQPVTAKDLLFKINRVNGFKELTQGYIWAHSLKITPRFSMKPHEDGQIVEIHISGENNLNTFLDLFEFHTGLDLKQVNPATTMVKVIHLKRLSW